MEEVIRKAIDFLQFGSLAAFGAMAKYMNDVNTGKKEFKTVSTFVIIFIAFFLGNVIVSFLGTEHEYLGGILMVAGWSLDKVLALLEVVTDEWLRRIKKNID